MRNFELTQEEIIELRAAHKSAKKRSAADAYKINAIILLGDGWSLEEVSNALLMDEEVLRKYVNDYKTGGIPKLINTNYKGSKSFLTQEQATELQTELDTNIHLTTQSVVDFVKNKFNIDYSISGMTALLHKLDYVYKKPKLIPKGPSEEIQEAFIECYKEFMRTKSPKEAVFFVDAVHPEYNTMAAYGWLKKGQPRPLLTKNARRRLNLHGAINPETLDTFVIEGGVVDSDSTIALLETIDTYYPLAKGITLIFDNAAYHKSTGVKEFLKNNPKMKAVYLPSGAPNLNLIERLWKFFKKTVIYNKCFERFTIFRGSCLEFFKSMPKYSDSLWQIMTDEFEIISSG
jgi:transposase